MPRSTMPMCADCRGRKCRKAAFTRFPTWMWRNGEVADFLKRLKAINETIGDPDRRCGFYGLDVYSLSASIEAVLTYLDKVDPETARIARERYGCLAPWRSDPVRYGRMALSRGYAVCEKPVADALLDLLKKRLDYLIKDGEAFFSAEQNARIVTAAEQYYRVMYYGDAVSWNLRDQHMFDTLERLLPHRGPGSKAVVWAHNSHIGNAEFTEMGQVRGEHNIGQLARDRFGDNAALIGFGTDRGTVAAASDWNGPMEIKRVRPRATIPTRAARATPASRPSSWRPAPARRSMSATRWPSRCSSAPSASSTGPRPSCCHIISRPSCRGNSMPGSGLPRRKAVAAHAEAHPHGPDETYPFGL